MFAFIRRPAPQPQPRPFGEPGISAEQYERIAARLREQRRSAALISQGFGRLSFQPSNLRAAARLKSQLSTTTN